MLIVLLLTNEYDCEANGSESWEQDSKLKKKKGDLIIYIILLQDSNDVEKSLQPRDKAENHC